MPTQQPANLTVHDPWTPSLYQTDSSGDSSSSGSPNVGNSPTAHAGASGSTSKRSTGHSHSKTRSNMLSRDSSSRSKSYSPGSSSKSPRRHKLKSHRSHRNDRMVCYDCGTTDTPQWRVGVNGPGTLCNVCGLLFAKRTQRHVSQFY